MKDVVFFTPNTGMKSATEFILNALNEGNSRMDPPRFSGVGFDEVSENKYDTHYRGSHENMLSLEVVQVCGMKDIQFILLVTLQLRPFTGNMKIRKRFPLAEKQARFPEVNKAWQESMRKHLGHHRLQDLWNDLLDVRTISRLPL